MKRALACLLCFSFMLPQVYAAQIVDEFVQSTLEGSAFQSSGPADSAIVDNFAPKSGVKPSLDSAPIKDKFIFKSLGNKSLSAPSSHVVLIKDDFAVKNLNNIEIEKPTNAIAAIEDIDRIPVKIKTQKYVSTRSKVNEGEYLTFYTVQDVKINNLKIPAGSKIKGRIETITLNGPGGSPGQIIVDNFSFVNHKKIVFEGQLKQDGANRSLWVYPSSIVLTPFFLLGLPLLAIRGGHAKLRPSREYTIYCIPNAL